MAMDKWHNSAGGRPTTYEMRWKRKPTSDPGGDANIRDYLWTLTACVPRVENGVVTGIFGCNTDITGQKEATRTALLRVKAERRLASFTATAPVGVYQCDTNFKLTHCNEHWFKVTGHQKVPIDDVDWRSIVLKDDLGQIERDTEIVAQGKELHTFSFRLRKLWTGPDGIVTPTWILATAATDRDEEGTVKSVTGTLTDVSRLKWAEAVQRNRVEEALESKRQQENFIDMTSHEMRMTHSSQRCCDSNTILMTVQVTLSAL
jgi:PAS domain S-box-containing protein